MRSYYDSHGDGTGDLTGLIEQLDYLSDGDPTTTDNLGITGILLMPMIESPGYHSYDAVDYAQIEAGYGTNEQFRLLIDEAHARDSADKFNNAVACVKTIGYNGKGHNNWLW